MQDHSIPDPKTIPYGYCHCGCGEKTTIADKDWALRGHVKGEPKRFVMGHGHAKKKKVELLPGDTKTCIKCKEVKDVVNFTPSNRYRDGFVNTCRECLRKYYKQNYDLKRTRERSKLRAARIKENGGKHTAKEWQALLENHGGRCAKCGTSEKVGKDHIVPISKGGHDGIENIQPLCTTCNLAKGVKIEDYRQIGNR